MVPVVDDREAEGELEMIRTHAASANRLQRAHLHVHGDDAHEHEPMIAAE
jgi:hypothetical protein